MKYWLRHPKITIVLLLSGVLILFFIFSLPDRLFDNPYSTVLEDKEGNLLSASIANDGQWRFPQQHEVPLKFKEAILAFEDKRFYSHPGVDMLAIGRALRQNINAGKVVSGGSTISMQVIRLMRKNPNRSLWEKAIEMILALRLELSFSKSEILSLYAAHAPFGGNVVGVEAASWRYFGRKLDQLSWSEAALLAVLPNNPSLIHLGKNRELLIEKRNKLLDRLFLNGIIDDITLLLAKSEALPDRLLPLPRHASHLLTRATQEGFAQTRIISTIDQSIQLQAERIVDDHFVRISGNQVFNAAAIVIKINSGETVAYVGNTNSGIDHGEMVDIITAPRSTGSILKPFLYAAMLEDGKILPQTLIPDVPTVISGFSPKNFSHEYDGAVPADKALIRSLNIPAVLELQEYRYEKFYDLLKNIGLTTLTKSADHYGLSLVLGGAEGTLWEITGAYASMARTLNNYFEFPGARRYHKSDFHSPHYIAYQKEDEDSELTKSSWLSASSIWITMEALKEVYRPGEETGWQYFSSSKPIAWKTGTSFGFRDGWAVGVTPDYAVGVWVGNADGEGRPGLTGTTMAAPIMFDLFSILPGQLWFQKPSTELKDIIICEQSGQRVSEYCGDGILASSTLAGLQTLPCTFHKQVHLSQDLDYQLNRNCLSSSSIRTMSWFVLPPVQEYYYKPKNLSYKSLPPLSPDCRGSIVASSMDLIYPKPDASIFIPRELDGSQGRTLFQAAHRSDHSKIYWHLDGDYIGFTQRKHHLTLSAAPGVHTLTLVDEAGESLVQSFKIISSP